MGELSDALDALAATRAEHNAKREAEAIATGQMRTAERVLIELRNTLPGGRGVIISADGKTALVLHTNGVLPEEFPVVDRGFTPEPEP